MKRSVTCLVLLGALLTAGAAAADSSTRSREVPLKGVDFNDRAQVERLYFRLKTTAREVCRDPGWPPGSAPRDADCAARSLDAAVARLNRPMLRLVHSGAPEPLQVAGR